MNEPVVTASQIRNAPYSGNHLSCYIASMSLIRPCSIYMARLYYRSVTLDTYEDPVAVLTTDHETNHIENDVCWVISSDNNNMKLESNSIIF